MKKRARHKKKKVNQKGKRNLIIFIVLIILLVILGIHNREETDATTTSASVNEILDFIDEEKEAEVSRYIVYGTHLNVEGSIDISDDEVKDVTVVAKKATGEEIEINTTYDFENGKLSFSTLENINEGLDLETLEIDNYYILLKVVDSAEDIKYYSMSNDTEYTDQIEYYTLTRNNSNNRINISFVNSNNISALALNVSKVHKLPDDVYDVVIDPGHGGSDGGAISGRYEEADIVLDCSLQLKEKLEELGLKVLITRDGTETDEYDTYNMYDEDGRVTMANESGAKILISLHMNSNESDFVDGGVEVYAGPHLDLSLAKSFADNIVKTANITYSEMETYKEEERSVCTYNRN